MCAHRDCGRFSEIDRKKEALSAAANELREKERELTKIGCDKEKQDKKRDELEGKINEQREKVCLGVWWRVHSTASQLIAGDFRWPISSLSRSEQRRG